MVPTSYTYPPRSEPAGEGRCEGPSEALNPCVEAGEASESGEVAVVVGGGGSTECPRRTELRRRRRSVRKRHQHRNHRAKKRRYTAALRWSPADENRGAFLGGGGDPPTHTADRPSIFQDLVHRPGSPGGAEPCGMMRLRAVGFPACVFWVRYRRAPNAPPASLPLSPSLSC